MIRYHLHDLTTIDVDKSVGLPLIRSLDFQIGYFRRGLERDTSAPYKIDVRPYSEFSQVYEKRKFSAFHLSRGISGEVVDEPHRQLAVERRTTGFAIYSSSPNFLVSLYVQFLLSMEGYSMVHAAGYCNEAGRVTLLAGAGGVGKTALLGHVVKRFGYKLLGDDVVIVGLDDVCLSFPRAFVFKEYHRSVYPELFRKLNIGRWSGYSLKRFVVENAPFLGLTKKLLRATGLYYTVADSLNLVPYLATVPVETIFGEGAVVDRGQVDKVIFLERYDGAEFALEEVCPSSMSRRLFSIIHHEWSAVMEHLLVMGALELIDLPEYFGRVARLLNKVVMGKKLLALRIPQAAGPDEIAGRYEQYQLV